MLGRFLPVENRFFDLFDTHAQHIVSAACELQMLLDDLDDAESGMTNVQTAERTGDALAHEAIDLLHKTFITPLDRDEIHKLITTMDDILDLMEDVATTVVVYDLKSVTAEASELADIVVQSAMQAQLAINHLYDLKQSPRILKACEEIDALETRADRVLRAAISKLFRDDIDVKTLIKLKGVYDLLERITDKFEDVANIVEGIVLENA
ncbi:MAG: DUF47 domain-containing protein [Burkholderia sp.]|jgi:hypothetical protein|uniref:DUF47 domain-containing protein n=1 Tax=Burkholderia TaxID=32008 RepID=UPI00158E56F0|nr:MULTISPECIES: DUF47 family protein [Burkholderia]MBY8603412.1 DUF47 family protein [Burkholderia arboris]MCA3779461.1 DUF47 domain-containing protein [Burkholderia sp.]MCA3787058.1 DUF47 domain-containing protein [Burkholderia sp.]MCA3793923.1 DUF47 domain-containing protein [Burkholderia sp.]MCA3800186.1 DUF47 domain-containing protein [Burkholderia sp.]